MPAEVLLEVGLFEVSDADPLAARLIGFSRTPELVELVRERLAAERTRDLARLRRPVRAVPPPRDGGEVA